MEAESRFYDEMDLTTEASAPLLPDVAGMPDKMAPTSVKEAKGKRLGNAPWKPSLRLSLGAASGPSETVATGSSRLCAEGNLVPQDSPTAAAKAPSARGAAAAAAAPPRR